MKQFLTPFLIGAALMILGVFAAHAGVGDTFPEIGCTQRGDCYSMLCTVVTPQREHCVKVPLPRARPESADTLGPCDTDSDDYCDSYHPPIPCDTDSDCMAKNPGVDY